MRSLETVTLCIRMQQIDVACLVAPACAILLINATDEHRPTSNDILLQVEINVVVARDVRVGHPVAVHGVEIRQHPVLSL